jgi:hypothetical protein
MAKLNDKELKLPMSEEQEKLEEMTPEEEARSAQWIQDRIRKKGLVKAPWPTS